MGVVEREPRNTGPRRSLSGNSPFGVMAREPGMARATLYVPFAVTLKPAALACAAPMVTDCRLARRGLSQLAASLSSYDPVTRKAFFSSPKARMSFLYSVPF